MKVREMMEKINDLNDLQAKLTFRSNQDEVIIGDGELMREAADAISDYVRELYLKEVKV